MNCPSPKLHLNSIDIYWKKSCALGWFENMQKFPMLNFYPFGVNCCNLQRQSLKDSKLLIHWGLAYKPWICFTLLHLSFYWRLWPVKSILNLAEFINLKQRTLFKSENLSCVSNDSDFRDYIRCCRCLVLTVDNSMNNVVDLNARTWFRITTASPHFPEIPHIKALPGVPGV